MVRDRNVHGDDYVKSDFTGTIVREEGSFDWVIVQIDDGRHGHMTLGPAPAEIRRHFVRGARVHGRIAFPKNPPPDALGDILRLWPEEHWIVTKLKQWLSFLELRTKDPVLRAVAPAPAE